MLNPPIGRPEATEHAPYFSRYIELITEEEDVIFALEAQREQSLSIFQKLDERQLQFRYAADKWSVAEVIGHVIDTERILTFRALYFARNNQNAVPGYDQNVTAKMSPYASLRLADMLDEYDSVRRATVHLFRNLDRDAWLRRGVAKSE